MYEACLCLVQGSSRWKTTVSSQLTSVPRFQWSYKLFRTCSVGCDLIFDVNAPIIRMVYTNDYLLNHLVTDSYDNNNVSHIDIAIATMARSSWLLSTVLLYDSFPV